jgi:hypothetical protein
VFVTLYYLTYILAVINILANVLGIRVLRVRSQPHEEKLTDTPVDTDNVRDEELR